MLRYNPSMVRLLILDDEFGIRTGIASYFPWAALGIEVAATCENGFEALEFLAKNPVDLVLCDIRMPRMDGIRFAQLVRERRHPCEIVFISAHKDFEYAKKALELGVRNYIVKPAGYEELREVFAKLMHERETGATPGGTQLAAPETPPAPAAEPETHRIPATCESLAERVFGLFEKNLKDICLTGVARDLGLSPNYLSARLHAETGKTFSELLTETRMERAKTLLADRDLRVHEISALVGYASAKSFIRAFRCHFGTSPTGLRGATRA